MKKITLCLMAFIILFNLAKAQPVTFYEAPLSDNSTTQVRAPNGTATQAYMRACALVLATELTNIASGTTLTSFGFTVNSGAGSTVPGTFTLYLENTTDVSFTKSLTFSTAIAPMTSVYANTMNLPGTTLTTSITVTLSTPFVYTGGGIYVAYDWFSAGPFAATPVTYRSNSTGLLGGCASGQGTSSAPLTLGTTNFRPCFLFGTANTFTNEIQMIGMEAPGRIAGMFNTPHNIVGVVKNASNITKTNIPVTLNVGGANTFANTQTITSLASGAVTSVTFAAFNPTIGGLNTISVTIPSDQNNTNNLTTYNQSVTCNEWAINPAAVSYTMGSVGFNTGSGIIAVGYNNIIASALSGIRGAISTNSPSVGNSAWGVLLSSTGSTLATTNTITISNAMLGTFQTFSFTPPVNLTANTSYYLGFAQPANATLGYFPMGTYTNNYVPFMNYVTTTTLGGTPAPLTSNLGYFGIEAIFVPFIPISAPSQTINCGSPAVLTASTANSYSWVSGPANSNYTVNPLLNTNYTVSTSNGLCFASNIVSVTVNPIQVGVSTATNQICSGQTAVLSGTGASSFTWTPSSGSPVVGTNYQASPLINSSYTLAGNNANGCTNSTVFNLTVNPIPNISITTNTNIICLGSTVTLTALGNGTYTWSTLSNSNVIVDSPSLTTTYSVLSSNSFNCLNSASIAITVNSFTPGISSSTSICLGSQAAITASGGAVNSYTWSNGITFFNVINVTPTVTTTYSVEAYSSSNNCLGSNSITINVLQNPTVTASASRSVMCRNESNTITAIGASTYSWSSSETTNSIVINPTTASVLVYTVMGTASNNCSKSSTIAITVNLCTGVDGQLSNQTNQVLIYPNPTQNAITIDIDAQNDQFSYALYSSIGQLIHTQKIENKHTKVDLSEQAPGIYFIHILQNNRNLQSIKVIKE